jgi:hypothetical protein
MVGRLPPPKLSSLKVQAIDAQNQAQPIFQSGAAESPDITLLRSHEVLEVWGGLYINRLFAEQPKAPQLQANPFSSPLASIV